MAAHQVPWGASAIGAWLSFKSSDSIGPGSFLGTRGDSKMEPRLRTTPKVLNSIENHTFQACLFGTVDFSLLKFKELI